MHKRLPKISAQQLVIAGAALIGVYFLMTGAVNAIRAHQLRQHEQRIQQDIQDLKSRYDRLQALKEYLNSDEYVESVAREELGLVKQGEQGIVAISSQPAPTPAPGEDEPSLWWDALIR